MTHRNLRVFVACLLTLLMVALPMAAKNKADKYYKDGKAAEAKGDWDAALDLYLKALDLKPNDAEYMIAMRNARFQAGEKHIKAGQKLRSEGKLEDALSEFEKALIVDPSSAITLQEIRRTQQMMKTPAPKGEERGLTPVERARRATEKRLDSIQEPPELHPVLRTVGPLKINNQPVKLIYETVGKVAGVNVLFDSQFTPNRNFNLELTNPTSPERAFDYLAVMTHTFWKPVSENAIFVTEDNPTKHRDYDDEVVKTFYVTNATSAQEFQEIATAVRTVADIRRVFTYNAQKAMIVRGSVDAVELAEKMIHDLDKPKAEVVVDMIVMQVNSDRAKQLAATIINSTGTPGGLSVPFVFAPSNAVPNPNSGTSSTSGASGTTGTTGVTGTTGTTGTIGALVPLNQLSTINSSSFATSLPGGLLNLVVTDTKTKVLNSPTLRISDGMKAELKIGQRIPYATGSFQPGVGTVGVSPLVSTQFNYVDTGVNVTLQPQVHSDSELTLHVEVDVSSVVQYENLGGLSQPVIGQNKNTADIRLREGEVTILGGLSQLSDSKTVNGIPGLVDIPGLGGTIFGSTNTDKSKSELLIALIPHIVRTPDYTEENLRGIYVGNDANVKLIRLPDAEAPPPAPEAPKAEATKPQIPAAGAPVPAPAAPAPTPGPTIAPSSGETRISFNPPSIQVSAGAAVTLTIQVENVKDLFSAAPLKIKYDASQLRLNDMSPGDVLSRDGARISSVKEIRNDNGEATFTLARSPGSNGISGSGALAVLNFVAVGKGSSTVSVTGSTLKDSQGRPLSAGLGEAQVKVQ